MQKDIVIDGVKLEELEKRLKATASELCSEINKAILNKQTDMASALELKRYQCEAQIRLLNNIKNGLDDPDYVIC